MCRYRKSHRYRGVNLYFAVYTFAANGDSCTGDGAQLGFIDKKW